MLKRNAENICSQVNQWPLTEYINRAVTSTG